VECDLPEQCDVAIIGGGLSGLTAGALLAQANLTTCVIEAEKKPGGYLAGFRRGDFIFDSSIHWMNQCGPNGLVKRVFEHIDADSPRPTPLKRIRRHKGDSFDYLMTSNPDELKEQFIADFPTKRRGIEKLFKTASVLGQRMDSVAKIMRAPETMSVPERLALLFTLVNWSRPFWRCAGLSAEAGLKRFLGDDSLKEVFCTEELFLSILVPIGWAYGDDFWFPPPGGAQVYPEWLCRRIRTSGSHVILDSRVEQVLVDKKRVTGIKLADGREIRARYVIAACDVQALYERMLPAGLVSEKLLQRQRNAEIYQSAVTLSIGTDIDPRSLGFGEELILLTRDAQDLESHNNSDPHTTCLSILAPSIRDPTLAPQGKGTLTIYASANIQYGDNWKTDPNWGRGETYRAFKKEYADTLIERVEKAVAPGLRDHIEVLDVATPVTYLRYTGNREGSIMGQLAGRTNVKAGVAGYRTPVKNLLLAGHWAEYGGGIPMAIKSAANTALMILRRENREAFRELCKVFAG